ncbi:MAG: AMP-binding protein [Bacteroidales bacterium]|nr:AMP-binding protein [Bacteroidales bacterium]
MRGACSYTVPHDQIKYSYVYGLLEDHKITFGAMVPSMIRYLRPYFDEIHSSDLRCNILTAEASPVDLVNEWSRCIPNAEIYNFYGPTETTIYCTFQKYNREGENKHLNGMMSIGRPMPGINAVIINDGKEIVKNQEKGELCICGDQITPGYWDDPIKNGESFFETEFGGKLTRFYKTGDLCYRDSDGEIMLAGRLDHQVKIQGYRIELGEIEYHAREFLKGKNAIATAFTNSLGNTEIALFIEGKELNESMIIEHLKKKLPPYMLPSLVITVEDFPLNNNGKIDRLELKKRVKQE